MPTLGERHQRIDLGDALGAADAERAALPSASRRRSAALARTDQPGRCLRIPCRKRVCRRLSPTRASAANLQRQLKTTTSTTCRLSWMHSQSTYCCSNNDHKMNAQI